MSVCLLGWLCVESECVTYLFGVQLPVAHKWPVFLLHTCTQPWPPCKSVDISLCVIPCGRPQLLALSSKRKNNVCQKCYQHQRGRQRRYAPSACAVSLCFNHKSTYPGDRKQVRGILFYKKREENLEKNLLRKEHTNKLEFRLKSLT